MAVLWVDSTNQAGEADSSISLVLMATINANDIIVVHYGHRGASSVVLNAPTHGSLTFTEIQPQSGGAITQQKSWWARAAGGEGGTTVTCTKASGTLPFMVQAHRYSGCITTGSPIDATSGALQENTGAGATVTFEAMTIAATTSLVVVHYVEADDDQTTTVNFTNVDMPFTQVFKRLDPIGTDIAHIVWTGIPTDTSPASTTWTQTAADEYSIQQFALIPPGAAADIAYLSTPRTRW